jgi:hypothetical protein
MAYVDPTGGVPHSRPLGYWKFFGNLLGVIGRASPIPMPTVVRFSPAERQRVHKETTDRWVNELAIAVAATTQRNDESEQARRYPMYLAVAPGSDRCYRVGNGPVQRNITYELYDNEGQFMSGATIKEELVALEGSLPVTGRESSSPPIYRDQLSTLSGGLAFSCNVSESRHCQDR